MKKSKVIIPAMALLLFSTAASVTGTVAWFSSTRVFTMNAAQFGINTVDASLNATVTARIGTKLKGNSGDDAKKIVAGTSMSSSSADAHPNRLYHGSFDYVTSKAWILNPERSGDGGTGITDVFNDLLTENGEKAHYTDGGDCSTCKWLVRKDAQTTETAGTATYNYYVAFSWEVSFSISGAAPEKSAVYLDRKASTISVAASGGVIRESLEGGSQKTATGFRVAMYPVTDAYAFLDDGNPAARVFGNSATTSYVNDSDNSMNAPGNALDATHYMTSLNSTRRDESLSEATVKDYADTICFLSNTTAQKVIFVAWFEGTDPGVVSDAQMNSVEANLVFYSRSVKKTVAP